MSGLDERSVADIANELRELGDPLADEAATALERVAKERELLWGSVNNLLKLNERATAKADAAEAKLAEALARLETVEAETRERCAKVASPNFGDGVVTEYEQGRRDAAQDIRNLEPRHD